MEKSVDVQSLAIGIVIAGGIMTMMHAVRTALADSTLVKRRISQAYLPRKASPRAPRSGQRLRPAVARPSHDAGRGRS